MILRIILNQFAVLLFWTSYLAWILAEIWYIYRDRGRIGKKDDKKTVRFVEGAIFFGIFLAFFSAWRFPGYHIIDNQLLALYIGVALIWTGLIFRFYAVHVLGKYFRRVAMIQSEDEFLRSGPYRYIRHPSYAGSLITLLGCGIVLHNMISVVSIMLFSFLGYLIRMSVEEALLEKQFGKAYLEYEKRTKRLIPFVY